jgi:hypothetical protein
MVLRINSNSFHKSFNWLVFVLEKHCVLWGSDWISIVYTNKINAWKSQLINPLPTGYATHCSIMSILVQLWIRVSRRCPLCFLEYYEYYYYYYYYYLTFIYTGTYTTIWGLFACVPVFLYCPLRAESLKILIILPKNRTSVWIEIRKSVQLEEDGFYMGMWLQERNTCHVKYRED